MVEHAPGLGDQERPSTITPGSRWRNILIAIGFFSMIGALVIGASMKEAAGNLPKFIAFGAIGLIVISCIWALIDRISRKGRRGPQTTV